MMEFDAAEEWQWIWKKFIQSWDDFKAGSRMLVNLCAHDAGSNTIITEER
jgi:hypothetical protein